MKNTWLQQIVTIEQKGYAAFLAGIPYEENPYLGGYSNQNGPGGSAQRQRRSAWRRGWDLAKKEQKN